MCSKVHKTRFIIPTWVTLAVHRPCLSLAETASRGHAGPTVSLHPLVLVANNMRVPQGEGEEATPEPFPRVGPASSCPFPRAGASGLGDKVGSGGGGEKRVQSDPQAPRPPRTALSCPCALIHQ